jgi:hypothetical protein
MTTPEDVYRLLGERIGRESTPATERLEPSRHTALFREHDVFLVRARDFDAFPHCRLARSSSSVGLCACDGDTLTYLHLLEPVGLARVLKKEGRAFFDAEPLALAELFAELASEGLRPLPTVVGGSEMAREGADWVLTFRSEGLPRPSDLGRVEVRVNKDFAVTFDITVVGEVADDSGGERAF